MFTGEIVVTTWNSMSESSVESLLVFTALLFMLLLSFGPEGYRIDSCVKQNITIKLHMVHKDILLRLLWLINTDTVEEQLAERQFIIKGKLHNRRQ